MLDEERASMLNSRSRIQRNFKKWHSKWKGQSMYSWNFDFTMDQGCDISSSLNLSALVS